MASVIVVGSGIAGLVTALTASATHDVTLVSKAALAESNTRYAQGGIAAAVFDDDTVAEHIEDTLRVGAGLNVTDAVRVLCTDGPERIRDLIAAGVRFDRSGAGLARGLEAAHSHARVLHAGGDATGAAIEGALVAAVRESRITVLEHTFVADLIVDDGRVVGVEVLPAGGLDTLASRATRPPGAASAGRVGRPRPYRNPEALYADAVVLASGGAGNLYAHTTNPAVATGDGTAAAWRAGARLRDLEFYQFHPTALALPGNFLVSEAVRGEGGVLLNQAGERFMLDVHPDAELAPRDVVARGIAIEMAAQGGSPVLLDATALGADFLARRFPTIDRACRAAGLDWARNPVPVTPAAHYWMGGIVTDTWGRTSLPGLFAVGEAACTGVHGANRLASNSLLEAAVFAHRAAGALARGGLDTLATRATRPPEDTLAAAEPRWSSSRASTRASVGASERSREARFEPQRAYRDLATRSSGLEPSTVDRGELQRLMWRTAGVHRSGEALAEAADTLASWRAAEPASATASEFTVTDLENANLLDLARLLVAAALARRESRGAHFRSDHPAASDEFARHLEWAREVPVPC